MLHALFKRIMFFPKSAFAEENSFFHFCLGAAQMEGMRFWQVWRKGWGAVKRRRAKMENLTPSNYYHLDMI